jgi:hypothetical protein
MTVLGRQVTNGVEHGSKPLRTGQFWFVNGFGHSLSMPKKNILMERIENVPLWRQRRPWGINFEYNSNSTCHFPIGVILNSSSAGIRRPPTYSMVPTTRIGFENIVIPFYNLMDQSEGARKAALHSMKQLGLKYREIREFEKNTEHRHGQYPCI